MKVLIEFRNLILFVDRSDVSITVMLPDHRTHTTAPHQPFLEVPGRTPYELQGVEVSIENSQTGRLDYGGSVRLPCSGPDDSFLWVPNLTEHFPGVDLDPAVPTDPQDFLAASMTLRNGTLRSIGLVEVSPGLGLKVAFGYHLRDGSRTRTAIADSILYETDIPGSECNVHLTTFGQANPAHTIPVPVVGGVARFAIDNAPQSRVPMNVGRHLKMFDKVLNSHFKDLGPGRSAICRLRMELAGSLQHSDFSEEELQRFYLVTPQAPENCWQVRLS